MRNSPRGRERSPGAQLPRFIELHARVAAGDKTAEPELYQNVYNYFQRGLTVRFSDFSWLGSRVAAAIEDESKAQADDAFLRARAGLPVYAFHSNAMRAAMRNVRRKLAEPGASVSLDASFDALAASENVEATVIHNDEFERALAIVMHVQPGRYRRWYLHFTYFEIPADEIAASECVAPATVRVGILRARQQIVRMVEGQALDS